MANGQKIDEKDDLTGSGWSMQIADRAITEYLKGLDLYRQAFNEAPHEPRYRQGLESCLSTIHSIAWYHRDGAALTAVGEEALRLARYDRQLRPDDPKTAKALAAELGGLLRERTITGATKVSEACEEILAIWKELWADDTENPDLLNGYHTALEIVLNASDANGLRDLALTVAETRLEVGRLKTERESADSIGWRELIESHFRLGRQALDAGEDALAQKVLDEGMQLARASLERLNPNELALLQSTIHKMLRSPGRPVGIPPLELSFLALDIQREKGKYPDYGGTYFEGLVSAFADPAQILRKLSRFDEARELYEEQLEIGVGLPEGRDHSRVVDNAQSALSSLARDEGKWDEARPFLEQILARSRNVVDEYEPARPQINVAQCLRDLALVELRMGEAEAARSHFEESVQLCARATEHYAEGSSREFDLSRAVKGEIESLAHLSEAEIALGMIDAARASVEKALKHARAHTDPSNEHGSLWSNRIMLAEALEALARLELAQNRQPEAVTALKKALAIRCEVSSVHHGIAEWVRLELKTATELANVTGAKADWKAVSENLDQIEKASALQPVELDLRAQALRATRR